MLKDVKLFFQFTSVNKNAMHASNLTIYRNVQTREPHTTGEVLEISVVKYSVEYFIGLKS